MMSDFIFVLSDQNGDLVGHMSFQEKKIFAALEQTLILTFSLRRYSLISNDCNCIISDFSDALHKAIAGLISASDRLFLS